MSGARWRARKRFGKPISGTLGRGGHPTANGIVEGRQSKGRVSDPGATVGTDGPSSIALDADAASALIHLGYSEMTATDAVAKSRRESGPEASLEQLLRTALRNLVR